MDVTLNRARPREIPVSKPSTEHAYIPKVLLRDEEQSSGQDRRKPQWLPSERTPGASKHLLSGHANGHAHNRVEPQETVSELDVERLQRVDDELSHLESELDAFVHDFRIATATFSAQALSQKLLLQNMGNVKAPQ